MLSRPACSDDEDVLVLELARITEVVRVEHLATERLDCVKLWRVWCTAMASRDDDVVELLGMLRIADQIMGGQRQHTSNTVVGNVTSHGMKSDPLTHVGLLRATLDVIEQHGTRRITRKLLDEVFLERVVGELQTLLWAVRPQVTYCEE